MVDDNDDIDAAAIQSLVEIAQLNPTQARNALKHYGNSLENACNAFFNGSLQFTENDAIKLPDDIDIVDGEEEEEEDDDLVMIDGDGTDRRTRRGNENRRSQQQEQEQTRHENATNQQQQQQQLVPLLPVRAVFGLLSVAVKITSTILSKILPSNVLSSLSRAFRAHRLNQRYLAASARGRGAVGPTRGDPIEAAKEFRRTFMNENDGNCLINFVELSHSDALRMAKSEYKLCFVYLHSPIHDDALGFCKDVLNDPNVASFVNEKFVAWGGDVSNSDALLLALGVSPSSFPYCALLNSSGSRVSLVVSVEGYCDSDELLEVLEKSIEDASGSMIEARSRNEAAENDRLLREEQDAAFRASLAADAAKEAKRVQEMEEEEARLKEAENERLENERIESENRRKEEERAMALKNRREEKAARLKPEPEMSVTENVTKIAFRMADGSRVERRFASRESTLNDVYDFVDTLECVSETKYSLVSNFPRKVFHRTDELLIEVSELSSNGAMLFVQSEEQ